MTRYRGMFRLFPIPGTSEDGFVVYDKDVIKHSLLNLIKTHKGSRVYDPHYGTNLHLLIHEQNIQRTRNIAKVEIEEVVTKYEPRAEILAINVYPGKGEHVSEVVITLHVRYVEFDEEEEIEIRLQNEEDWIREEEIPPNPYMGQF